MPVSDRYRVNSPRVGGEVIDGEAILIDFLTGTYYSLPGSGAYIWEGVVGGASRDEIVDRLLGRYDVARDQAAGAVDGLLEQLLTEDLVVRDGTEGQAPPDEAREDGEREAFSYPELAKYSDMEHLLLLDPVHEVGTGSWPAAVQE